MTRAVIELACILYVAIGVALWTYEVRVGHVKPWEAGTAFFISAGVWPLIWAYFAFCAVSELLTKLAYRIRGTGV